MVGGEVQRREPVGVGCVARHVAVEIGGAVVPPDGATLAERDLGGVNPAACGGDCFGVPGAASAADDSPRVHQLGDQRGARVVG